MRTSLVATALATIVVLAGCSAGDASEPELDVSTLPVAAAEEPTVPEITAPVITGPIAVSGSSPEEAMPEPEVAPTGLSVPGLGLGMRIVPVGVDSDGEMEVPESADIAGWYRFGPGATAGEGHVVLAAHVDDPSGLGPFARLRDIDEGERIVIAADGVRREYRVSRIEQTDKQDVDLDAVFSRAGEERLVLVTCGGSFDWDARSYSDNVIVWAEPMEDAS
ncbi:class F sortase [Demequina zhanjiangensis]|uniref:Class F sortase n=1 Tax=Demequina zhanjiangensis TaxID=3051659 RepID=A0ABT8FWU6_9MICO|nr:class F sortase [Demequina sp. SYSU T00b26]MDN4471371.1 class F sortase [Demequina sp. SYSU T00b26]